jgi:hypothetical protein
MRRLLILAALFCVAAYAGGMWLGSYVHHKRSIASFAVDIPDGTTVKIYKDKGGDAPFQYDPSKPLSTLTSDRKVSLKIGIYDFVVTPGNDYAVNVVKETVNRSVKSVRIDPDLSQTKLESMLAGEKGAIAEAVNTRFSKAPLYYSVDKTALYKHGEWAGVLLKPRSAEFDPVRLVLSNKSGSWKVVNEPSILFIGSLYPEVPPEVVSSVNSL